MFWTCITAKGPGYGTTIIEGSINSSLYVEILQSSLKDGCIPKELSGPY
jgi:hypothetical protein